MSNGSVASTGTETETETERLAERFLLYLQRR